MDDQPVLTQTQVSVKPKKKNSGVVWGLILIIGGLILLGQQLGWLGPRYNWWALFILAPALASFGSAFTTLQNTGKFGAMVRAGLGGGIVLLTLALMFLFGLDWAVCWPLMVLAGGLSIFLEGISGKEVEGVGGILNIGLWIGLGIIFLGAGFLLMNLDIYDIAAVFGKYRWWAVAILIPGLGALLGGLVSAGQAGRYSGTAFGLTMFGLATLAVGVVALVGVSWEILTPTLLILAGLAILFGIFRKK